MSVGTYELREIRWTPTRIALVLLSLLTAGLHFAMAVTTGNNTFAALAVGLLAGFVVFFTDLWEPVLYLLGALYIGVMTVIWVLAGMPFLALAIVDKVIQAVLFVLFIYLLITESRSDPSAETGDS